MLTPDNRFAVSPVEQANLLPVDTPQIWASEECTPLAILATGITLGLRLAFAWYPVVSAKPRRSSDIDPP
jgi:hypothetical protein